MSEPTMTNALQLIHPRSQPNFLASSTFRLGGFWPTHCYVRGVTSRKMDTQKEAGFFSCLLISLVLLTPRACGFLCAREGASIIFFYILLWSGLWWFCCPRWLEFPIGEFLCSFGNKFVLKLTFMFWKFSFMSLNSLS